MQTLENAYPGIERVNNPVKLVRLDDKQAKK